MNEEKIKRYEIVSGWEGHYLTEAETGHVCLDEDVTALESQLPPDLWETVTEWEERTGKKYPDDGPVWYSIDTKIPECWHLCSYGATKESVLILPVLLAFILNFMLFSFEG